MAVSRSGSILSTSSGFAPDQNQSKPDFESALHSENGYGYWIGQARKRREGHGRLARGARRKRRGARRGAVHRLYGARRPADYVCRAGPDWYRCAHFGARHAFGHLFRAVYYHAHSGTQCYGGKIAKGDFDVRVKKEKDDELGALCDSINDMAAELGTAEKMKKRLHFLCFARAAHAADLHPRMGRDDQQYRRPNE